METMGEFFAIVLGWPAVIFGAALCALAFAMRSFVIAVVAVVCWVPFCLYISLYPAVLGLGVVAIATNVISLVQFRRRRYGLSAVFLAPFALLASSIALLVIFQPGPRF